MGEKSSVNQTGGTLYSSLLKRKVSAFPKGEEGIHLVDGGGMGVSISRRSL